MQLDRVLVVPALRNRRYFLNDTLKVIVLLGVFVKQLYIFAANLGDVDLFHEAESLDDLRDFFRALYHNDGPLVADSGD